MNVLKFFCGLLLTCLSLPGLAATALTMEQAIRMAVEEQPYLRYHDSNVFASTTMRFFNTDDPAMAPFKTAVENFRSKQNPLTEDIASLADSFLTPEQRGKGLVSKNRQVKHGAESTLMAREVARDAALAWLELYEAQRVMPLLHGLEHDHRDQIAASRIALTSGKASLADVVKAEDALNAVIARSVELKSRIATAEAELKRWTDTKSFVLAEKFEIKPAPTLEEMRQRIAGHPQQQIFWLAVEVAEAELNRVEDNYKPDPKIEFHKQEVVLTAIKALRDKIDYQAADNLRLLEQALSRAYAEWEAAQQHRDLVEKSVVPNATLRSQAARIAYGNGAADFSAVLEARRDEREKTIELLHRQIDAAKARIRMGFYE